MARHLNRGEVRWYKFARPDKKRPVVILTRDSALKFLDEATIAPVTSTIRGATTEGRLRAKDTGWRRPDSRRSGRILRSVIWARRVATPRAAECATTEPALDDQPRSR